MFDGSDPCWIPTVPIPVDREWRLRIAQFGDGYQQRTLDGINALDSSWPVTFENVSSAVALSMDAYLTEQGAGGFPFRDPASGVLYTVFCDSWHIDYAPQRRVQGVTVYYASVTAEFRKANGVAIAGGAP